MFFLKTFIFTILLLCSLNFEMMIMNEMENDDNYCSELISCGKCTEVSFCKWSLERQTCVDASSTLGNLAVTNETNCPQYSLASNRSISKVLRYYEYTTKVSNDVYGFMDFLSRTVIQCVVTSYYDTGKNIILKGRVNGSFIFCDPFDFNSTPYNVLFHCFIKFDGTILRMENVADHYILIDPMYLGKDRCFSPKLDKDCVSCAWNDKVHTNVLLRCLKSKPCTGVSTFYNRRYVRNYTFSAWDKPTVLDCPAVVDVSSVEPATARWRGATNVMITVKNQRILYADGDLHNVTATVAGSACHVTTVNRDSVACTVDAAAAAAATGRAHAGPVLVTYRFSKDGGFYRIAARRPFGWDYPVVTGTGPACGPLEGGTVLTVNGSLLASGGADARVTVAEGRPCDIVSRTDGRIACRTGRAADGPAAGRVAVTFGDGPLTVYAPRADAFEYVAAGPAVDARQRFGGIVSGGTSVPVRGARLRCAENPSVYVRHFGARAEAGCRVTNASYMVCRSPRLVAGLRGTVDAATAADYGFVADFAGRASELTAGPGSLYTLYPDPRFAGFEVTGDGVVVLHGRELGAGYLIEDVEVRFRNSTAGVCTVTRMTRDRIECEPTMSADGLDELRQIVVVVGDSYSILSKSKNNDTVDDIANKPTRNTFVSHDELMIFSGMIILIAVVLLILYFIFSRLKNNVQCRVNSEHLGDCKYEKGSVNLIDTET